MYDHIVDCIVFAQDSPCATLVGTKFIPTNILRTLGYTPGEHILDIWCDVWLKWRLLSFGFCSYPSASYDPTASPQATMANSSSFASSSSAYVCMKVVFESKLIQKRWSSSTESVVFIVSDAFRSSLHKKDSMPTVMSTPQCWWECSHATHVYISVVWTCTGATPCSWSSRHQRTSTVCIACMHTHIHILYILYIISMYNHPEVDRIWHVQKSAQFSDEWLKISYSISRMTLRHHPTHRPPAEMSLAPSIPHVDLRRSGEVSRNGSPSKSSSYWGTQLLEPTIYHMICRIYRWQR